MRPDRLRDGWKYLLALYLVSFALPIQDGWGVGAFVVSLLWGFRSPVVLLFWVANPLFWFGLYALRKGRYATAAAVGCASSACAFLPLPTLYGNALVSAPGILLKIPGYFAWFASTLGLAALGLAAWARSRPRIHIRTLMLVVLAVALALGAFPPLIGALRRWISLPGA